jgi:Zn-dependent protease/CBS domain-containing protein
MLVLIGESLAKYFVSKSEHKREQKVKMGNSLKLFSVRGIDIRLHITFPLILLWAGLQFGLRAGTIESALFGVIAIGFLFVLVTLHELGHSFAAQYFGVPVKQIILTPLGGVAQLNEIPDKPVQEFIIAIAGPAVNVVFAILMGAIALNLGISIANPFLILSGLGGLTLTSLFIYVFYYNIILALFNLIPAFPLDGGRIFRSLLAMRLDYVRATTIASTVGQVIAVMLGIYGLFSGGIFLVLIAVFIFMAGRQEAQMVRVRNVLRGVKVQQAYSPSVYLLNRDSTVQQASNLMIYGGQRNFPVVESESLIGFLPHADLIGAMRTAAPHSRVDSIMRKDVEPVAPGDNLFDVQRKLAELQLEALPVAIGNRFLGLITRHQISDVHRLLLSAPNTVPQGQSV